MGRMKEKGETFIIPVDLINDPEMLVRDEDEETDELRKLGESMLEVGQINPITLVKDGQSYDLVTGHRRVRAARLVKMPRIEARVIPRDPEKMALIRWSENSDRLQNNVVEEARFLKEMMTNLKCTQSELAKKISRSTAFVSQRLTLWEGPEELHSALKQKKISWDVAREFLQFKSVERGLRYLEYAIASGANARQVREWRTDADLEKMDQEIDEALKNDDGEIVERPENRVYYCDACRETHFIPDLTYVRVCRKCERIIKSNT